jgi:hypothetical protein
MSPHLVKELKNLRNFIPLTINVTVSVAVL